MSGRITARLAELGIVLPHAPAPAANYVPWVREGALLFISGQVPFAEGRIAYAGRLGESVSVEDGQAAARLCFINIMAQAAAALEGDLDRVRRVARLGGFVACTAEFTQHPAVINGASDLAVAVFGDAGRHARAAVGAPSLPLGSAVEVEAVLVVE